MPHAAPPLASGFVSSANTVLLVVSIISGAVAIVSILGGLAVVFGGSWRKSEMEMLRQSRADLTSVNGELVAQLTTAKADLTVKDQRITELTSLVTQAKPFAQITDALEKHQTETAEIHKQILEVAQGIASKLGARRG